MSKPRYYTTSVSAHRSVGNIQGLLNEHGAKRVMTESQDGKPAGIAWSMETPHGEVAFRLQPKIEGVRRRMKEAGVLGKYDSADPADVAWKQIHVLIEMQLEAIANEAVTAAQVFGGLAMVETGETVADMIEGGAEQVTGRNLLALPNPR